MPNPNRYMRLFRGVDRLSPKTEQASELLTPYPFRPWETPKAKTAVNMTPGSFWASSNPLVAESYLNNPRHGVVLPLDLIETPDVILQGEGRNWRDWFDAYVGGNRRSKFYKALRSPEVRSILVEDIVDPGMGAIMGMANKPASLSISDYLTQNYMGNNLLVKDPSVLRYSLTREPVEPWVWRGREKYAGGGKVGKAMQKYLMLLRQKEYPDHGMEADAFFPIPTTVDIAGIQAQQRALEVGRKMAEANVPHDATYDERRNILRKLMPIESDVAPDLGKARELSAVLKMMELRSGHDQATRGPFLLAHEEGLTREQLNQLLSETPPETLVEWMKLASPYKKNKKAEGGRVEKPFASRYRDAMNRKRQQEAGFVAAGAPTSEQIATIRANSPSMMAKAGLLGLAEGAAWPLEWPSMVYDLGQVAGNVYDWATDRGGPGLVDRVLTEQENPALLDYPISRAVERGIGLEEGEMGPLALLTELGAIPSGYKLQKIARKRAPDLLRRAKNRYFPEILPPEPSPMLPTRGGEVYDMPITNSRLILEGLK